jgi:hypothetical protein
LVENASHKPDNHAKISDDRIKGQLGLRDMLKSLTRGLPEGISTTLDEARKKILLPSVFFSSWSYHVVFAALLDHSWIGVTDLGSMTIPRKVEDLYMAISCCRLILEMKVGYFLAVTFSVL